MGVYWKLFPHFFLEKKGKKTFWYLNNNNKTGIMVIDSLYNEKVNDAVNAIIKRRLNLIFRK